MDELDPQGAVGVVDPAVETTTARATAASVRKDAVLAAAVELARDAALETSGIDDIGEHLGYLQEGERLGSHYFATTAPGYHGWRWTVTVSRIARSKNVTVCEVALLPGDGALLAPAWVPWAERLAPGDVGATDMLPYDPSDERLETGYRRSGDDADEAAVATDQVAIVELGLERERVPTRGALRAAAQRWLDQGRGVDSPGARASSEGCETCGFLVPLGGYLGTMFGVCINEWSPDDGRVVAFNHGCGAHSETDAPRAGGDWPDPAPIVDEFQLEVHAP